jgi:hypothetical protein
MRDLISRLLAATWLAFLVAPAGSADIKISDNPLYDVILEGTIVPGDYDKLRKLIDEWCPARSYNSRCPSEIYLASPGGSLTEAMKIGRLVRALRWGTKIPSKESPDLRQNIVAALKLKAPQSNYMCASACFFISIGGIERLSTLDEGLLGIHRPYMSDADLKTLSANQAMASTTQVRTITEAYLKEMGVPSKYADLMFSIPKDQVRWISEADFQADFAGLIPELKDWMNPQCDQHTDVEKRLADVFAAKSRRGEPLTPEEEAMRLMLLQKLKVQVDCEGMVKDKLREAAWKAYRGL